MSELTFYERVNELQNELEAPNGLKSGVYAIVNPNDQVYVGSTNNVDKRFYQYKGLYEISQPKLYNSLKKYGAENHKYIVIEYCEIDKLYERERFWGEQFDVLDRHKGLNLMLPGHGEKKLIMSFETKQKIGKAHKGKKLSEEHKKALVNSIKGKKQTPEHIEKRKMVGEKNPAYGKAYFKGKKHTKENKEYFSKIFKERYKGGGNPNSKKVIDNNDGTIYDCAKEVAEKFNINYSTLKAWLQGVNKNEGRFEYVE